MSRAYFFKGVPVEVLRKQGNDYIVKLPSGRTVGADGDHVTFKDTEAPRKLDQQGDSSGAVEAKAVGREDRPNHKTRRPRRNTSRGPSSKVSGSE